MKYVWVCSLLALLACTNNDPSEEALSPSAEPKATILSEADIERLSHQGAQYTLDDTEIIASPEGIQGSLDELTRKTNQFEADLQRVEQVSGGTSSINLNEQALQQLTEAKQELKTIFSQLDAVRKAKAQEQYEQAVDVLRQVNRRIRYAEALYNMALADENVKATE